MKAIGIALSTTLSSSGGVLDDNTGFEYVTVRIK
jgi:hypothetical protein